MYPFKVHPPFLYGRERRPSVTFAPSLEPMKMQRAALPHVTGYAGFFNGSHRPWQRVAFPDVPRQLEKGSLPNGCMLSFYCIFRQSLLAEICMLFRQIIMFSFNRKKRIHL